jgi:hypothetical protein
MIWSGMARVERGGRLAGIVAAPFRAPRAGTCGIALSEAGRRPWGSVLL